MRVGERVINGLNADHYIVSSNAGRVGFDDEELGEVYGIIERECGVKEMAGVLYAMVFASKLEKLHIRDKAWRELISEAEKIISKARSE